MTAKKLNYEPSPCGKRGPKHPRGQVRADILAAAHKIFVRYHYQEATVRKIAAEAEVDPGLINYYFGTKQRLFREAMALPADPARIIHDILSQQSADLGRHLSKLALEAWEQAATAGTLSALFSALVTDEETQRIFRNYFVTEIVPVIKEFAGRDGALIAQVVGAYGAGLILLRYVVKMEPIASIKREDLMEILQPVLRALVAAGVGTTLRHRA